MNERDPHPSIVYAELIAIRAEKDKARRNEKLRFQRELKNAMRYDIRMGRPWSVTIFTRQQMQAGERILNEIEDGRQITHG